MTADQKASTPTTESLDPENWDAFSAALSKVFDASLEKFQSSETGRVWTPPSEQLLADLDQDLPREGTSLDQLANSIIDLLPYGVGNTHPRFFGWVHGSGSPGNLLAEIAASAMNANCGGRDHIAIYVERQVINWCKSLFQFPSEASGLIVSGTSMATIIAAKTARDAALDFKSRQGGVGASKLVGYTSSEAHSCLARAFDMIGLGTDALRLIPVDTDYRIDPDALRAAIVQDRRNGFQPFFVSGTAGTVNTGAIDDLDQLSEIAMAEDLWFHVDGAFAACGITSEAIAPKLSGLEKADSLAFDFHKWLHVNYDAGCVLIKDSAAHRKAFATRPDYLAANGTALAGGEPWPVDFGPELSRGFRALKVWAHLREHGTDKLGRMIEKNCNQAQYLASLVHADGALELLAPTTLNICCFRHVPANMPREQIDEHNASIVAQLQMQGIAAPSTTRLNDQLAIRVNITNHRTTHKDIDILVESILRIGRSLSETA